MMLVIPALKHRIVGRNETVMANYDLHSVVDKIAVKLNVI
jgi:hypothetical protein